MRLRAQGRVAAAAFIHGKPSIVHGMQILCGKKLSDVLLERFATNAENVKRASARVRAVWRGHSLGHLEGTYAPATDRHIPSRIVMVYIIRFTWWSWTNPRGEGASRGHVPLTLFLVDIKRVRVLPLYLNTLTIYTWCKFIVNYYYCCYYTLIWNLYFVEL